MALPRQQAGACVRIPGPHSSTFLIPRRLRNPRDIQYGLRSERQLSSYVNSRARVCRQRSQSSPLCARPSHRASDLQTSACSPRRLATFWGWRMQNFWHRPGCKWVRSEGDLRYTPRDKDCPACQHEERRPMELSHRELVWQRQMQFMKDFFERDPYQALFGRSNDRLRGIIPRALINDSLRHPWLIKGWKSSPIGPSEPHQSSERYSQVTPKTSSSATAESGPQSAETKPTNTTPGKAENPSEDKGDGTLSQPTIHGYGKWKVSTTDSSGNTTVESGEMVYDPISMRMVPSKVDQQKDNATNENKPSLKKETESGVAENSTPPQKKTIAVEEVTAKPENIIVSGSGSSAVESASASTPAREETEKQVFRTAAAETKTTSATQREMRSESTRSESITVPEQRLALIRKVESELSLARTQLKDLVCFHISNSRNPYKMASVGNALTSLRKTQMALETLKESTPQGKFIPSNLAKKSKLADPEADFNRSSSPENSKDNSAVPIKHALENSWTKNQEAEQPNSNPKPVTPSKSASHSSVLRPSRNNNNGHYRQTPEKTMFRDVHVRKSQAMVLQRDRPLKHLNSFELATHRNALLNSWVRKLNLKNEAQHSSNRKLMEEVKTQKAAMSRFESHAYRTKSQNEDITKRSSATLQGTSNNEGVSSPKAAKYAGYERWFKQRAPQALKVEQEKLADQSLVTQIREIYEQSYGVINETHRQPKVAQHEEEVDAKAIEPALADNASAKAPTARKMKDSGEAAKADEAMNAHEATKEPKKPDQSRKSADQYLYRILAYDPSTQSVHSAIASSSYSPPTGDKILSMVEALPRLSHPAKFVPYLSEHQSLGYEVVSANKHLLVLKRVHEPSTKRPIAVENITIESAMDLGEDRSPGPIAGKVKPVVDKAETQQVPPTPPKTPTGNFASPTGFVNHDIYGAPTLSAHTSSSSRPNTLPTPSPQHKVRKEEPVFTGRASKQFETNEASRIPFTVTAVKNNGGTGNGTGTGRSSSSSGSQHRSRRGSRRTTFRKALKILLFGGVAVASGSYLRGWWIESSETRSVDAYRLRRHSMMNDKNVAPPAARDVIESSNEAPSRPGFWAAVNREQARRTEEAEARQAMQRFVDDESARRFREQEVRRKVLAAAGAGVEIALFGTFLWAVMKLLESGK